MTYRQTIARFALLAIAAGALTACELRREDTGQEGTDGGDSASAPTANPVDATATPTPSPSASASPPLSIFREESAPAVSEEELAEPVEVTIPFPDGADVDARAERILANIVRSDAIAEGWPVILSGHTDSAGNDQANLRASRARAEAVAAWLVERGVEDRRIRVIAFGEQNPAELNANSDGSPNEQGRRANRRVEVRIAPESRRTGSANASDQNAADES